MVYFYRRNLYAFLLQKRILFAFPAGFPLFFPFWTLLAFDQFFAAYDDTMMHRLIMMSHPNGGSHTLLLLLLLLYRSILQFYDNGL